MSGLVFYEPNSTNALCGQKCPTWNNIPDTQIQRRHEPLWRSVGYCDGVWLFWGFPTRHAPPDHPPENGSIATGWVSIEIASPNKTATKTRSQMGSAIQPSQANQARPCNQPRQPTKPIRSDLFEARPKPKTDQPEPDKPGNQPEPEKSQKKPIFRKKPDFYK